MTAIRFTGALAALLLAAAPAAAHNHAGDAHKGHGEAASGHGAHAKDGEHAGHCGLPMGEGVIEGLDVRKSRVTLAHEGAPALGGEKGSVKLETARAVDLAAFVPGERVHFMLAPEKKKTRQIAMMCSLDADEGAHMACMAQMQTEAERLAAEAGMACAGGKSRGAHDHH